MISEQSNLQYFVGGGAINVSCSLVYENGLHGLRYLCFHSTLLRSKSIVFQCECFCRWEWVLVGLRLILDSICTHIRSNTHCVLHTKIYTLRIHIHTPSWMKFCSLCWLHRENAFSCEMLIDFRERTYWAQFNLFVVPQKTILWIVKFNLIAICMLNVNSLLCSIIMYAHLLSLFLAFCRMNILLYWTGSQSVIHVIPTDWKSSEDISIHVRISSIINCYIEYFAEVTGESHSRKWYVNECQLFKLYPQQLLLDFPCEL